MNIEKKYNRDDFLSFLKSFVPKFTKDVRHVAASGLQVTKEVFYLGESVELDLSIFELTHSSSTDARVALAMDGFKIMKSSATYRALVIYRSEKGEDWRLSLMTASPVVNEKGKVSQSFSNPRRFSFFLGPNAKTNTPYQFLIKQDAVKDFAELQKRFSLEVVNKEFYSQIALLFTQLAGGKRKIGRKSIDAGEGYLKLPPTNDDIQRKEFSVRLIGRLVFCWFLKKKCSDKGLSLLPEELLSSEAVSINKDYYHNILEPLFFEILNTPIVQRKKKYQRMPWDQIPFLNGGLFNPHIHDFYQMNSKGEPQIAYNLVVPEKWLKELFDIFETYNFTINENTSVDIELSIEPEMLGRIFENLLAEINPETGETARKATGSYYTPRAIVEYMVDESLKQYLLTKTKLEEDKIRNLLKYEDVEIELSTAEKESVLNALNSIKIIDPACGSGAFPMGILQKMLLMLQKIDPESKWWLDKMLSRIGNKTLEKKLKVENISYIHKLGIIQNTIYGVDIQPIAVDISKLRFFLSLIVDENIDDSKKDRGVEALPNLEFKFVCANSLICLPKVKNDNELFETEDIESIKKLEELRGEYLKSFGDEKIHIEKAFLNTQNKMWDFYLKKLTRPQYDLLGNEKKIKTQKTSIYTQMLAQWNPFSEETCSWFDPKWMFGIKDGFDIVIANPPYMTYSRVTGTGNKNSNEDKQYKKLLSYLYPESAEYKISTYAIFMDLGIKLLNLRGTLCFITPETFSVGRYFSKLRKLILDKCKIHRIVLFLQDFWKSGTVGLPTISFFIKENNAVAREQNCLITSMYRSLTAFENQDSLTFRYNQNYFFSTPYNRFRMFFREKDYHLINKIEQNSIKAENIIEMHVGIRPKVGYEKIQSDTKIGSSWEKGFSKGNEVHRFYTDWSGKYLNIEPKLLWGGGFDKKIVSQKKLLMRKTGNELIVAIDPNGLYHLDILHSIVLKDPNVDIRYLCALFNSKCINYYYQTVTLSFNRVLAQINIETIEKLPTKKASPNEQQAIGTIVDKILSITKDDDYLTNSTKQLKVKEYECQIDQMVYNLYGLTKDEIKIVEETIR